MPKTEEEIASPETVKQLERRLAETQRKVDELEATLAARSAALTESVDHQAAAAEVLAIISKSPSSVDPVLDKIADIATRLCKADHATIFRVHDGACHLQASQADPEFVEVLRARPLPLDSNLLTTRAVVEKRVLHIADVQTTRSEFDISLALKSKSRTLLAVPLQGESEPIGVITIGRYDAQAFTDSQVDLIKTFADQAVIAIENARLFEQVERKSRELATLNNTLEERISTQVEELDRLGRLRRFLPRQLAEVVISSGDESMLDSHRRDVSVIIGDLRGFTAFSEISEPEEVMVVLDEYHRIAGPLIEGHGGTIERFRGDGLLVLFNDPLPCEDPVLRAVRLAVELRNAMGETCSKWDKQGYQLGFGVGVAHGYATLGRIGFEGRMEYTAIGTVVNQAARLCDEAQAGEILITQRVANVAKDLIQVEPLGELPLKGFRQPVQGFRLLSILE